MTGMILYPKHQRCACFTGPSYSGRGMASGEETYRNGVCCDGSGGPRAAGGLYEYKQMCWRDGALKGIAYVVHIECFGCI